ncbi:MAG TPA: hypothetical protein VGB85_00565 [Nannocystis sp.]|jgi:hypothetical protein
MAASDPQYWRTLAHSETLVRRLQGFLAGAETHESLQAWAQAQWTGQDSPVCGHAVATGILMNLWNAEVRDPSFGASGPHILRRIDVVEYLWLVQRGEVNLPTRDLGCLRATPAEVAARLGRETERHVLDGIGWCEYLRLASPGSGRVFMLERPLHAAARGSWVRADRVADTLDVTRDLFETLTIDLADIEGFAGGFVVDPAGLPRWTLWRQDDNGIRAEVADFTGRRKAEAVWRHYESLRHKQLYWLEDR